MKEVTNIWKYIVGIVLGIICNIGPMYFIQYFLKLPFFMDTIGSITVAFCLGGIPAIICAVITEFLLFYIEHYISWIVCLYGLSVWAAIGIIVILNKSISVSKSKSSIILYLFIASILMAFAVSIVGGFVNTIDEVYQTARGIYGDGNKATSLFRHDLLSQGVGLFAANVISRVPSNLIERPVTTFVSYGIFLLHKRKFRK